MTVIDYGRYEERGCKRHLRTIHELVFSVNLSMAITSAVLLGGTPFIPFVRLAGLVNRSLGRQFINARGGYVAFSVFAAILVGLLVLILRFLRRTAIGAPILVFVGGLSAVAAAPAVWFYIVHWHGWYPVEVIIFTLCAWLYLVGKWRIPPLITIVLVAVHYGVWTLQFWHYTRNPAEALLSIVGCISCLIWGAYVRA